MRLRQRRLFQNTCTKDLWVEPDDDDRVTLKLLFLTVANIGKFIQIKNAKSFFLNISIVQMIHIAFDIIRYVTAFVLHNKPGMCQRND